MEDISKGKNMKTLMYVVVGIACILFLMPAGKAVATELVWVPLNPSFGGYAGNAAWLMSSAQAQNSHVAETAPYTRPDPMDDFEYTLKRSYLSALSRKIMDEAFGEEGLLPEGETEVQYSLGDYTIDITTNGMISIVITDIATGDTTTVEVPYFGY
jgi:curli production assembly/transport component CsgF